MYDTCRGDEPFLPAGQQGFGGRPRRRSRAFASSAGLGYWNGDRDNVQFKVFLMNKDLETFNTIAKELHVPVSFSNVAQRYEQTALAAGLGDMDTSVVMTVIEKLAALEPRKPA